MLAPSESSSRLVDLIWKMSMNFRTPLLCRLLGMEAPFLSPRVLRIPMREGWDILTP